MTFVRKASGLVRQVSTFDAFVYAIATMTFFWATTWYFWGQYLSPGSDINLALLIGAIFMTFNGIVIAFLINIYPRSGGDYVYNTRILNPTLGYVVNFAMWGYNTYWIGMTSYWVGTLGFSALFASLGIALNNPVLTSIGYACYQPLAGAIIATIVIAFLTIVAILGMRPFFKVMKVGFFIGIIGTIVLIVLLSVFSRENFVSSFNSFMANYAPDTKKLL